MTSGVVLIGMPGAGKSTVGKALAAHLRVDFIDTDDLIAQREGMPNQRVLDLHGAVGFRSREESAILACPPQNVVVATGGSAVYSPRSMEHLRGFGPLVFLKLPLELVRQRIPDADTRAIVKDPGQTLEDLFEQRNALYHQWADHVLDASQASVEALAAQIRSILVE